MRLAERLTSSYYNARNPPRKGFIHRVQTSLAPRLVAQPLNTTSDRPLFIGVCLLLASYFYTIPVIRTPLGMTTWLRLDDLMTVFLVVTALMSTSLPPGLRRTRIGSIVTVILLLMPFSLLLTFISTPTAYARNTGVLQFMKYIEYFVVLVVASRVTITPRRMVIVLAIVLGGSIVNGIVGGMQVFGLLDPARLYHVYLSDPHFLQMAAYVREVKRGWTQALGLLSYNYIVLGVYMVIGLGFVMVALSCHRARGVKALAAVGIIPIAAGLGMSGSRTALLMVLVMGLALTVFARKRVLTLLMMLLGLAATAYAALQVESVVERVSDLLFGFEAATAGGGRLGFWIVTVRDLVAHPFRLVLGYGLGASSRVFYQAAGSTAAHNNYVQVLGDHGLVGVIMWLVLQTRITRQCWAVAFRSRDLSARAWGRGVLAVQLAMLCGALFAELYTPQRAMASLLGYYSLLIALTYAVWRDMGQPRAVVVASTPRVSRLATRARRRDGPT